MASAMLNKASCSKDLSDTVNDLTICPICLDTLKVPKYFTCLHTFCLTCIHGYLAKLFKDAIPRTVKCPSCRTKIKIPDGTTNAEDFAKKLPVNHIIMSLIDAQKMCKGKSHCGPCKKLDTNRETNAKVFCVECKEAFCQTCSKYHMAFKAFTDHELVDIDKVSDLHLKMGLQYTTCNEHLKKIELFCKDHQKPCCLQCDRTEHRKCNEVEAIDEVAKKLREGNAYLDLMNSFGFLTRSFTKAIDLREELLNDCEHSESNGIEEIKDVRRSIDQISFNCGEQLATLSRVIEDFKDKKKMVIHCQNLLKAGLKCNSDIQLLYDYNNMKTQKEELESFLQEHENITSKEVVFEVNSAVEDTINKLTNIGKVVVREETEKPTSKALLESDIVPCPYFDLQANENIESDGKFSGVTFHDNRILLVEYHKCRLYVFGDEQDDSYEGKVKLKPPTIPKGVSPWDVTGTTEGRCIVSFPKGNILADICLNTLSVSRIIQMDRPQTGLAFYNNTLIGSCRSLEENESHLIRVYNMNGNNIREYKTMKPNYVHVDEIGRIFFSTRDNKELICLTYDFKPVFTYSHEKLGGISGITSDPEGNIYVAGFTSNNIHQLTPHGKLKRILLDSDNDIACPRGITYKRDVDILIVLNNIGSKIDMFQFR